MYVYIYVCVYMCVYIYVYIYICIYIYYIGALVHIYLNICTSSLRSHTLVA